MLLTPKDHIHVILYKFQDGKVEPQTFTEKLQIELKSSPQPYLVPFLKVSQLTVLSTVLSAIS